MTANPTKLLLPEPGQALPGRGEPTDIDNKHYVHSRPIRGPFDEIAPDCAQVLLGLGCFWGAERKFWQIPGVYTTAVGYAGGVTPNPSYEEVCSGLTAHTEVVLVVYQPSMIDFKEILRLFFESHDPTQGMRQGNDLGTQYRSAIYTYDESQNLAAKEAASKFQQALSKAGYPAITTEIREANEFYYAETYHQQYLAKNPNGYCGIGGTGVTCIV